MPKRLAKKVGFGGANLLPDVRVVQYLLNCVPFRLGGPRRELVIDGFVGPNTVDSIRRFQQFRDAEATGFLTPHTAAFRGLLSFDPFPNRELPFTAPKTDVGNGKSIEGGVAKPRVPYPSKAVFGGSSGKSLGSNYGGAKDGEYNEAKSGANYDSKGAGESSAKSGGGYGTAKGGADYDSKDAGESSVKSGGGYGTAKGGADYDSKAAGDYDSKTDASGPAGSSSAAGKADDSSGGGAAGKDSYQGKDPWGFYNPESPYFMKAGFGPNAAGAGDGGKSVGKESQDGSDAKSDWSGGAGKDLSNGNSSDPWGFYNPASPYYHVAGKMLIGPVRRKL
jgi:hypothetical protein